jgi:hypothetical protein
MTLSNIEARLNKRRNAGESVIYYINEVLRCERSKADPPTFQDFRPYLTAEELQEYEAMIAEQERREAEEKAKSEARRQAELQAEKEERNRIVALSPERRDAELMKKISDTICIVGAVEDGIEHNVEQFNDDRLPWSIDGDRYEWRNELQSEIAEIVTKYINPSSPDDGEEWMSRSDEEQDWFSDSDELTEAVDEFVAEVISDMLCTVHITYDRHFAESEEYRKLEAELMAKVMKLYQSRISRVAETVGTNDR